MPARKTRGRAARFGPARWALLLAICAAVAPRGALTQVAPHGDVDEVMVKSPALEGNLLGDSPTRHVSVYLPPSYGKGPSHYPTVYLLHGFLASDRVWIDSDWVNIPKIADKLIAEGAMREMIIVMPDASNRFLGSFYSDSAATGRWEEFIAQDLVRYIDKKYRTAARAESRGIAGHSMGGYGALKIAMKHPDVFSAVYAMSACCMEWGQELGAGNVAWDRALSFHRIEDVTAALKEFEHAKPDTDRASDFFAMTFVAMGAAWSPDPEHGPLFTQLPVEKKESARAMLNRVAAEWSANMIVPQCDQYRANLALLRGLRFDVGKQEQFPSILAGARDFDQALSRLGIRHQFEEYEGTHLSGIAKRMETAVLPFFSQVLQ